VPSGGVSIDVEIGFDAISIDKVTASCGDPAIACPDKMSRTAESRPVKAELRLAP